MMHSSWWEAYFAKHNVVNVAYQNGIISHQFEKKKKKKKKFKKNPPSNKKKKKKKEAISRCSPLQLKLNQVYDTATVNPQTLLPQCEHILQ